MQKFKKCFNYLAELERDHRHYAAQNPDTDWEALDKERAAQQLREQEEGNKYSFAGQPALDGDESESESSGSESEDSESSDSEAESH